MQRLKLFSKSDIEEVVTRSKEECFRLTKGEIFMLDEALWLKGTIHCEIILSRHFMKY